MVYAHFGVTSRLGALGSLKYNRQMRAQASKAGRKSKQFAVGQSVRLQETASKGTSRKLMRLYAGPYQVLDSVDANEYTVQKIGEGKRIKFRVHADRLAPYNDLMELDTRHAPQCTILSL